MPTYQIEKLPDQPIVTVYFAADFGSREDLISYNQAILRIYDSLDAPVYQIADLTDLKLNFDDMINAIQIVMRGENTVVRHPNNQDILLVTTNRFYQIAARGLNTVTFGNIQLLIFDTVEAAMGWVEQAATIMAD